MLRVHRLIRLSSTGSILFFKSVISLIVRGLRCVLWILGSLANSMRRRTLKPTFLGRLPIIFSISGRATLVTQILTFSLNTVGNDDITLVHLRYTVSILLILCDFSCSRSNFWFCVTILILFGQEKFVKVKIFQYSLRLSPLLVLLWLWFWLGRCFFLGAFSLFLRRDSFAHSAAINFLQLDVVNVRELGGQVLIRILRISIRIKEFSLIRSFSGLFYVRLVLKNVARLPTVPFLRRSWWCLSCRSSHTSTTFLKT